MRVDIGLYATCQGQQPAADPRSHRASRCVTDRGRTGCTALEDPVCIVGMPLPSLFFAGRLGIGSAAAGMADASLTEGI
jgi:hypothetical protein